MIIHSRDECQLINQFVEMVTSVLEQGIIRITVRQSADRNRSKIPRSSHKCQF